MNDDATVPYDGTVSWLGHTASVELIHDLRAKGLNPWLTIITGYPVEARENDGPDE